MEFNRRLLGKATDGLARENGKEPLGPHFLGLFRTTHLHRQSLPFEMKADLECWLSSSRSGPWRYTAISSDQTSLNSLV